MRNIIYFIFIIIVGMISCQESKEKVFEKLAEKENRACPIIFDQFTRMDSTTYVSSKNLKVYYYTLTGNADNAKFIHENRSAMHSSLKEEIINSIDLKPYKDFGTTIRYIFYSGKNGNKLLDLDYSNEDYNKN